VEIDRRGEWIRLALLAGLIALIGIQAGWAVLAVIAGIAVMIFFHELGHYITAKRSGMKVTEFFLGIGPRIWSFRRGETEYGIKVIPVVAYVRIVGMSMLEEVDPADEARTYRQQSYPKRVLVASAGSAMHFLMAFVLLVLVLMQGIPGGTLFGMDRGELERKLQESTEWSVAEATTGSAAERAGLEAGDRIIAINGDEIESWNDVRAAVGPRGGETVTITYERDGQRLESDTQLGFREDDPDTGFLGVAPEIELAEESRSLPVAAGAAVKEVGLGLQAAVGALGDFFSPDGLGDYAGQVREGGEQPSSGSGGAPETSEDPEEGNRLVSLVGATQLCADLAQTSDTGLAACFINLNIFVGLFNLIPLLPFDGGHIAVATYERIRSRNGRRYYVDMAKLVPVTYAVVFGMILLGLTSLYLDLVDPINI
jgi:membrane-associated protease RseP (regulator of RpoE activity)